MNCKQCQARIKEAALGPLDVRRHAALNAHLAGCVNCQRKFDAERQLVAAIDWGLADSLNHQPSPEFAARVRIRLAAEGERGLPRTSWAFNAWASVGVAALAVLIVAIWLLHRAPPPHRVKRAAASGGLTQATAPTKTASLARPLTLVSPQESSLCQAGKDKPLREHRRFSQKNRAPQFQVLVQPGQWAAITELYRAAQSGRVDASSLGRKAAEDEQPIEVKPVEIKPLVFGKVQDAKPLDSSGL